MDQFNKTVVILCSGAGLGFYVPGLLISQQLRKRGFCTKIYIFEDLLEDIHKNNINKNVLEYRKNFKFAVTASNVPHDVRKNLDSSKTSDLYNEWKKYGYCRFISLSGNWCCILNEYSKIVDNIKIKVDNLHLDADLSTSWRNARKFFPPAHDGLHDMWLYNSETNTINYKIPSGDEAPLGFRERENRLLIHGGGWGIGVFRDLIPTLNSKGFNLDVLAYSYSDIKEEKDTIRYFLKNPSWNCWDLNSNNEYNFPPVEAVENDSLPVFEPCYSYNKLYEVSRRELAIISKPGAGTLIDSLSSCTPLIMLDCFGMHEKRNASLWKDLGYGVYYSDWEKEKFSLDMIEKCHYRLVDATEKIPSLIDYYVSYYSSEE